MIKIVQTLPFKRTVKKLHKNQKDVLYDAIRYITENPQDGQNKTESMERKLLYK